MEPQFPQLTEVEWRRILKAMVEKKIPSHLVLFGGGGGDNVMMIPERFLVTTTKIATPGDGSSNVETIVQSRVFTHRLSLSPYKGTYENFHQIEIYTMTIEVLMELLCGTKTFMYDDVSCLNVGFHDELKLFREDLTRNPPTHIAISLEYNDRREIMTTLLHFYSL